VPERRFICAAGIVARILLGRILKMCLTRNGRRSWEISPATGYDLFRGREVIKETATPSPE